MTTTYALNFDLARVEKEGGSLSKKTLTRGVFGAKRHQKAAATTVAFAIMDSPDNHWSAVNARLLHRVGNWSR